MTMLKTFDLKGNKQSFANWISNLSPTETPFISMIPKQKVDQVQYSWQTDRLSQPGHETAAGGQDPMATTADTALAAAKEGDTVTANKVTSTKVHHNFTQIFRKAVRVTDTTKKIALYGRNSELAYQMEKAGLELKRDLEHALLNSMDAGRPGAADLHGICSGVQRLVAPAGVACPDTGAVVHKVTDYTVADELPFDKKKVFGLTLDLYLVGARCNKIMFHPMHMAIFSDWLGDAKGTKAKPKAPHLHRMFDGMDDKYNAYVKKIRDPLGQEFTLIPNRHMPTNQLFFFNESDWTQMVLREPEKVLLAKMGSSEKHMIEMEVGLRTRSPFASGILEFNVKSKAVVKGVKSTPSNVPVGSTAANESTISVVVTKSDGAQGATADSVTLTAVTLNDDGTTDAATVTAATTAVDNTDKSPTKGFAVATGKIKHTKGARVKVKAQAADGNVVETVVDTYEPRD